MSENVRHYWLVMQYGCDRCGHRVEFYLEDGCEGPRSREVPAPPEWEKLRSRAPVPLPAAVPQTASGRFVLPVPFVAAACPKCQTKKPWHLDRGVLQHLNWGADRHVDTNDVPVEAGQFHYPRDWSADGACGRPILPRRPLSGGSPEQQP